jgi:hypothetical protein
MNRGPEDALLVSYARDYEPKDLSDAVHHFSNSVGELHVDDLYVCIALTRVTSDPLFRCNRQWEI